MATNNFNPDWLNGERRRLTEIDPALPERLALPVREAAHALGIGTTKLRELIASGELGHLRVARRLLVPREELEAYIKRQFEAHK